MSPLKKNPTVDTAVESDLCAQDAQRWGTHHLCVTIWELKLNTTRTAVSFTIILFAYLWVGGIALDAQTASADSNKQGTVAVGRATGVALQGDAASAVKALAETNAASFAGDDAAFRTCMINRFSAVAQPPADLTVADSWVATLAKNYVTYWQRALTKPNERDAAEQELRGAIGKVLGHSITNDSEFDSAEDDITNQAGKRGFHVLLGRTPPLRELMLWRKTTVEQRTVNLPEAQQSVTVNFLDDFVLRGWGYYATCGRRSAGGWATEQGLFAVVPAYKSLQDETFSVRFLAHESQHFADKRAFENLESWELEYRAKLAELALADSSQSSTVELICENRAESKDAPHGYADSRVVDDVTKFSRLQPGDLCEKKTLIGQPLRDAAKQVLLQDSGKRGMRPQPEDLPVQQ